MKYVYIAGPYTGATHDHRSYFQIDRHIMTATEAASELAQRGVGFFNPHGHSAHFEVIVPGVEPSYWYELDMHFLYACQALLLLPGWEDSKGARKELAEAHLIGMRVFHADRSGVYDEIERWAKDLPPPGQADLPVHSRGC